MPPATGAPGPGDASASAQPRGGGGREQLLELFGPRTNRSLETLEAELGEGSSLGAADAALARGVGADPSGVRMHRGPTAARLAAEHGAVAFAAGRNVVMGSSAPAPGTHEGDALLRHEAAHVAQQQDAADDPAQRRKPLGEQDASAEQHADQAAGHAAFGSTTAVARTGVQLQRATPAAHGMDRARYQVIERALKNLIAQKRGAVTGPGSTDMASIDAEIDQLVAELRVDFGVQLDRGKILDEAVAGKDMLVLEGRVVVTPSSRHYLGERLGARLELDHVPPGETLQIGWRWRTPMSGQSYRFLVNGPAFAEKTTVQEMALDTPFWALTPPAIEQAHGMEIVAEIYLGKTDRPTRTFVSGFLPMPERPVQDVKIVGAPDQIVQGSSVELGLGPWTPDARRYAVDWFIDDAPVAADQVALRHRFAKLGASVVRAEVYRVKRFAGIRDKQLATSATARLTIVTDRQYGNAFLDETERSPFRPKPVGMTDMLATGDRSVAEMQHRVDRAGSQQPYWKDRRDAQKARLAKVRELAPDHASAKPLPVDPTQLDAGGSYSGPLTAALVMTGGGGGVQPLTVHLTIHEAGGVWQARLIDSTSKKVIKADGAGATPLAAYANAFRAWSTDNEYPTGGRVVHRFAPPGWALGDGFTTSTSWKIAKEWVDGIVTAGGFVVGLLLLADPDPTISKVLGALIMAAVVARSSVAIYERIRNGGDVLSSENILDGVAIVTAFAGVGGKALRNLGIAARNPLTYRVGNWMVMSAVAGDAGTFVYASAEALAAIRTVQADPTMDDAQRSAELLRVMSSLFLSGALLLATNRELLRNGIKPNDFIKSDLRPGMKPELDVGSRLDAEYELKKGGQWTKDTTRLGDEAILDQLFTHRTRQDLESTLAKKIGAPLAARLADTLGNEAFVRLHHSLGEEAMAALARDIPSSKLAPLHEQLGTTSFASFVKELGLPRIKLIVEAIPAARIKALVDGLGIATIKRGDSLLDVAELTRLSLAEAATLQKLAALHAAHLKNLSHRSPAELRAIAEQDSATIHKLSALSPSDAAQAAPFDDAAIAKRLRSLTATETEVDAQLARPRIAHHLRETNVLDRGRLSNASGKQIKIRVDGSGKLVPIEAKAFVRLEPIPTAGTPATIKRVVIEAQLHGATANSTVRGELQQNAGQWEVPVPGEPTPKITIDVEPGGAVPYVNPERPPAGLRIKVRPQELAERGFSGGHTREAWNQTAAAYGDVLTNTKETSIRFRVSSSSQPLEMAAIYTDIRLPNGKTKSISDPKTIFEKRTQLDTFESHAKPYLSAKIDSLKGASRKPTEGDIISVDIPVITERGSDVVLKLQFPWRTMATGAPEIPTWWIDKAMFQKGSAFRP